MKSTLFQINAFIKGLVYFLKPHLFLGWLRQPFLLFSNTISLSKWISSQDKTDILDDFYTSKRDHSKRYKLYQYVLDKFKLKDEAIDYLEFGVCGGSSFKWWSENIVNTNSKFFGFDTFEGLPESWGIYKKGDMSANIPVINDPRTEFVKGLFQDSVPIFLAKYNLNNGKRKIVHLDADLFSSTLYALTTLSPYFKKGDIIFFDEFNVPNHEFFAFKIFSESFYVKTKLIGAVNNYYQIALIIL